MRRAAHIIRAARAAGLDVDVEIVCGLLAMVGVGLVLAGLWWVTP